MEILVGSAIRQDPEILGQFLESLDLLKSPDGSSTNYFFVLNDPPDGCEDVLRSWRPLIDNDIEIETREFPPAKYDKDGPTHKWTPELIGRMMVLKTRLIEKARDGGYDYLLYVDSDEFLHPNTLKQLISRDKDIITEISWDKWHKNREIGPSVWDYPHYEFKPDTIENLHTQSLVEVGGFGGRGLFSIDALHSGISYMRLPNLPLWGEDRYMAVRAAAAGFRLWCDTAYPVFHIYQKSLLPELEAWKRGGFVFKKQKVVREVAKDSVLIAVPNTGSIHPNLVSFIVNTMMRNFGLIRIGLDLPQGMPVDSNRNSIVRKFLASVYEYLFTVDSDIVPPMGTLERLLSHKKEIVGALCFSAMDTENGDGYTIPYPVVMRRSEMLDGWQVDRERIQAQDPKEPLEVDALGMACVLFRRSVFEDMEPPWFELQYDDYHICNGGEDYSFFDKAKKCGKKVWADLSLQCEHYKQCGLKSVNDTLAGQVRYNGR